MYDTRRKNTDVGLLCSLGPAACPTAAAKPQVPGGHRWVRPPDKEWRGVQVNLFVSFLFLISSNSKQWEEKLLPRHIHHALVLCCFRDLVDEAKNYLLLPQERPLMQGPRTRPRKPIRCGEVLFAGQYIFGSRFGTTVESLSCWPCVYLTLSHFPHISFSYSWWLVQRWRHFQCWALRPPDQRVADGSVDE